MDQNKETPDNAYNRLIKRTQNKILCMGKITQLT